jgi:hypothetical protein
MRQDTPVILRARFAVASILLAAGAASAQPSIGPVIYIAMENHNWTQPSTQTSPQQIYQNPAAPYINSLVTQGNANAQYVSYASNYQNVGVGIHPSEPNYIWHEAGSNLGVLNDNLPYGTGGTNQNTNQHLTSLLNNAGVSWKSYQEDIDVDANNQVLPQNQWISPINNISGTRAAGATPNAYNGSQQYNYAPKHNPSIFFTDTNGGNDSTPANPAAHYYAPMQQLQVDLANNTLPAYSFVTPNQFNDQHTALTGGFNYHGTLYTGDAANIAQGDNFLAMVVPQIMASNAFQNQNATIVIWNDETEGGDDPSRTSMEIVISKLAKGNAYNSTLRYTHSSDLKSLQELYTVGAFSPTGFLGDAANATDLADMFQPGALPNAGSSTIPAPGSLALLAVGGLTIRSRRRRS